MRDFTRNRKGVEVDGGDVRKSEDDLRLESRLRGELREFVDQFENDPRSSGVNDFVRLDRKFANDNEISNWATVVDTVDGLEYHVAPRDVYLPPFAYEEQPNFQGMFDSIADGVDMPDLIAIAQIPLKRPRKIASDPSVTTASYAESYILRSQSNLVILDPTRGCLHRAISAKRSVRIAASRSDDWLDERYKEFATKFSGANLELEIIDVKHITNSMTVYHGVNGFSDVECSVDNQICIEPNPYSNSWKEESHNFVVGSSGIDMDYMRKGRMVKHHFAYEPDYFRIDPYSLEKAFQSKRETALFFLSYKGSIVFDEIKTVMPDSITRRYVKSFPPYKWVRSFEISSDREFIYDVKVSSTTVMSRRHLVQKLGDILGLKVVPWESEGQFFVTPYSKEFQRTREAMYEDVAILESQSLRGPPIVGVDVQGSGLLACMFWYGEYSGKVLSPLEPYGTVHPVFTVGQGQRCPQLTEAQSKSRLVIFESRAVLERNIPGLIRRALNSGYALIRHPEYREIEFMSIPESSQDLSIVDSDRSYKSQQIRLLDGVRNLGSMTMDSARKLAYMWTSREMEMFVQRTPYVHYEEDRLVLSYAEEKIDNDVGQIGMSKYGNLSSLRSFIMVKQMAKFVDSLNDYKRVSVRILYLNLHHIMVVSQVVEDGYIVTVLVPEQL